MLHLLGQGINLNTALTSPVSCMAEEENYKYRHCWVIRYLADRHKLALLTSSCVTQWDSVIKQWDWMCLTLIWQVQGQTSGIASLLAHMKCGNISFACACTLPYVFWRSRSGWEYVWTGQTESGGSSMWADVMCYALRRGVLLRSDQCYQPANRLTQCRNSCRLSNPGAWKGAADSGSPASTKVSESWFTQLWA